MKPAKHRMLPSIETSNSKPNWLRYTSLSRRSQGLKTAARWDAAPRTVPRLARTLSHFAQHNGVMQTAALQRGCQECVWDVYWRDMKAYNEQVALAEGKSPPLDPFEVRHRLG